MFLCNSFSKDIQIILMLKTVKNLLQEVADFTPKSEKEIEEFRLKFLGKKGEMNKLFAAFKSVPIESKKLKGLDSLLSIAQMPKGIPVGTVAIGQDGAINAAIFAASIISINNEKARKSLNLWRNKQTRSVKKKPR